MMHLFHIASTYGSGIYNSGPYNGILLQIGPVTLPDTGAGWSILIGAALVAIGGGWAVWLRLRARQRQTT